MARKSMSSSIAAARSSNETSCSSADGLVGIRPASPQQTSVERSKPSMQSIVRLLPVAALIMSVAIAIPPSLAVADDPADAEHDQPAAGQTIGLVSLPKPQIISGVVAGV